MPDNDNPILKFNSNKISNSFSSSIQIQRRNLLKLDQENYNIDLYQKLFLDKSNQDSNLIYLSKTNQKLISSQVLKPHVDQERIDSSEIFDLIRSITDPEHPLTLEDLSVVSTEQISVTYPDDSESSPHVMVRFTPTIPHCSMATLIGLTLRVRLLRSLPERFKVDIKIKEGTHQSENSVNKQLNDKERVAAALENNHLLGVVEQCLKTAHLRGRKVESSH